MSPQRIQRRCTKGWRMPKGTVYVGRPSRFGSPFPVCEAFPTPELAVRLFRNLVNTGEAWWWTDLGTKWEKANVYRGKGRHFALTPEGVRESLAGKDLACWCPLDQPCHADVLLEVANR